MPDFRRALMLRPDQAGTLASALRAANVNLSGPILEVVRQADDVRALLEELDDIAAAVEAPAPKEAPSE